MKRDTPATTSLTQGQLAALEKIAAMGPVEEPERENYHDTESAFNNGEDCGTYECAAVARAALASVRMSTKHRRNKGKGDTWRYQLNDSELSTVLAALRMWQRHTDSNTSAMHHHFEEVAALTEDEIDALCERLNCGG